MTELASISGNHLYIECKNCKHNHMIAVQELIKKFSKEARVQDLVTKMRCAHCRAKGQVDFRIVYVGHSGIAMLGAAVNKK